MRKKTTYETLYRQNKANQNIIIDIALNGYNEFFHEWDNSAFRKRDIHQDLAHFLDLCSEDIPLRRNLEIQFCVKTSAQSAEHEDRIRASYLNYYSALIRGEKRRIKRIFRTSGIQLLVAGLFLFLHVFLSGLITSTMLSKVLLESLLIGGWVFTWEAFHGITIDILTPLRRSRELKRFIQADIVFAYS